MRPISLPHSCAQLALLAQLLTPGTALGAQATLSPAAIQHIDSVAMAELKTSRTPGSTLAIVVGDQVVYQQGYGVANVESGSPMRADLLFRLGSTTKMMTALAALQLSAKGVVALDQPIGEIAPALTAPRLRRATLRQLLTHTAGLLDYTSMAGPHDDAASTAFVPTLTDTVYFTAPGDIYSYSNLGFAIAGYVLSTAAKKPYADVMRDEVFAPLGMPRSTLRPIEAMTWPLAQGHDVAGTGFTVTRPAPDDARYWPAGSVFSSAPELARLATALLNRGRVGGAQALSPEVVDLLLTPQADVPALSGRPAVRYAFGLNITTRNGLRVVEHSGSRGGYGSLLRLLPDQHAAVVVLGNRTGVALEQTLEAATEALTGVRRSATAHTEEARAPEPGDITLLVGRWTNGGGNWFEVQRDTAGRGIVVRFPDGRPPVPVQRLGARVYRAAGQTWFVASGADGQTRYVMVGRRAYRRAVTPPAKR